MSLTSIVCSIALFIFVPFISFQSRFVLPLLINPIFLLKPLIYLLLDYRITKKRLIITILLPFLHHLNLLLRHLSKHFILLWTHFFTFINFNSRHHRHRFYRIIIRIIIIYWLLNWPLNSNRSRFSRCGWLVWIFTFVFFDCLQRKSFLFFLFFWVVCVQLVKKAGVFGTFKN